MKSELINELAMALSKAQGIMLNAIKDSDNPFFKSKYADLAGIWDAIRVPLSSNGLSVVQGCDDNKNLETILIHSSGQWISSITPIFNSKNDAQGFGSGMTYARRYALSAIAGMTQEDDDGNLASNKNNDRRRTDRDDRIKHLLDSCKKLGIPDAFITKTLGDDWYEGTDDQYITLSNERNAVKGK